MMTSNGRSGDETRGKVSRRTVLKAAATGAAVLSAPLIWRRASADPKRIVIRDAGGPYRTAFEAVLYRPFRAETGIEVVGVTSVAEPTAQIKQMVETRTYTWDMATGSQAAADLLAKAGYLEPLELEKDPDVSEILPGYVTPYFVGNHGYSAVLAYRTDAFRGERAPKSWADLWDVGRFPGRRAMRKHPFDTIEEALMADGVPKEKVYPCDIDRAFQNLDRIKKHVAVWWTGGAQSSQLLKTGEVQLCGAWTGRVQAAIDDGAPVGIAWDGALFTMGGWYVLKGNPKADLCRRFIRFAANAKRQAEWTRHIVDGPANPNAYKYIDPKRALALPTNPDHYARSVPVDYTYWGKNKDRVLERFNAWLIS